MFYGPNFAKKIDKMIDDEVLRFARNAERAAGGKGNGPPRPKAVFTTRKRSKISRS
jgi:hypothetical protein